MSTLASMKGGSFLALRDLTGEQITGLLDLSAELKAKKKSGEQGNLLSGRNIALVFEKSSTRTRVATTVAAVDEGASPEYLDTRDLHLGKKESVKDTARVLGRMVDGIMFRGFAQKTVELLAEFSGVPVWNGLTDQWHPTQILADMLTAREALGEIKGLKLAWVGDGRNNVANSMMFGCAKLGVNFANCTPPELSPDEGLVAEARAIAAENGSTIEVFSDPKEGVAGANIVYTDVWISMGEEDQTQKRLKLLRPYQIDMDLMKATGNVENGRVIFLHCLPAFHDTNTEFARDLGALEVTDDVFEAEFSKVFDQAENRMHTIKAVMVATLA